MSSNKKILAILGVVLLVLCCGIGWVANLSNMTTPKATATMHLAPPTLTELVPTTAVSTATTAPLPTATPLPTNTLAPTATEIPTETTSAQDEISANYRNQVISISLILSGEMDHFSNLNNQASTNPNLILDPDWNQDVRSTLADLVLYSNQLSNLDPVPSEMQNVQIWLNKLGPEMEALQQDYLYGLDNLDANALTRASNHLTTYNRYLTNANSEIEKLVP